MRVSAPTKALIVNGGRWSAGWGRLILLYLVSSNITALDNHIAIGVIFTFSNKTFGCVPDYFVMLFGNIE